MVMNFNLTLNPTSIIIVSVIAFHWGKGLFLLILSHLERRALAKTSYSQLKYGWDQYTKEEFKGYKDTAGLAVTYNFYSTFYYASALVAIVIFEAFHVMWQLSVILATKYRLREESVVSLLYMLMLRTLFFVAYLPMNALKLIVTHQAFGAFLWSLLWLFIKDSFLILILTIPAFHLIKYFYRNIIFLISVVYFIWTIATAFINIDIFTSLEPLEDGILKKTLQIKVFPEIGFSIDDVYHSNEEINEKVYLRNSWMRKTVVITGPLPVSTNVSLIGDSHDSVQYTVDEVIALILFRIGEASNGYLFSTVLSTTVHLITLMLVCSHLYQRQYVLQMAGFRGSKPAIANLLVIWYFVIQPYWTFIYYSWRSIYEFTQLTEAQFMVSHFSLQQDLVHALVKVYHSNNEFPFHDYWYSIFNGYKRPLNSLDISATPPGLHKDNR